MYRKNFFFPTKAEEEQVAGATSPNVSVNRYRRAFVPPCEYPRERAALFPRRDAP